MNDFHLQGAIPINSPAYIERPFEQGLLRNVLSSNWVLLLGPRQHGKTSCLIRILQKLRETGITSAIIDLQALPPCHSFEECLEWFAFRVAKGLGLNLENRLQGNEARQLSSWLEAFIPIGREPIAIIIDEASAIANDDWRNSFYGQIRSIANERATAKHDDLAARLRFIFAGSFRPESMVNSLNSPFNVCVRIDTEDFSVEDAINLNSSVTADQTVTYVRQAYELVGGQPYLLQFILSKVYSAVDEDKQQAFDSSVKLLREGQDDHFEGVFSRVLAEAELTRLVSMMVVNGRLQNEPANPNFRFLQILGIAKREGAYLVFRNRLYWEFARNSSQLIQSNNPAQNAYALIIPPEDAYSFLKSRELSEFAYSMEVGAVRSYNSGGYRLALAGFGSALEAVLIDWYSTIPIPTLNSSISTAQADRNTNLSFYRFEDPNQPQTWRLINLIKVARHMNNTLRIVDPPDALRDWRNVIHPMVAIQNYLPEDQLEPEARAASGLIASLRRDIAIVI